MQRAVNLSPVVVAHGASGADDAFQLSTDLIDRCDGAAIFVEDTRRERTLNDRCGRMMMVVMVHDVVNFTRRRRHHSVCTDHTINNSCDFSHLTSPLPSI